jgi:YegS/Rv2252/BmrU family lipid kinase
VTLVDLGCMNDRLFVNAATGGYGAEVTAQTSKGAKKVLGGLAYLLSGITHLSELTAHPTRVIAPGFEWSGDLIGFMVGNGRQAGGGFKLTPHAILDDGLLDVVLLPRVSLQEFGALAKDLIGPVDDTTFEHLVSCQVPWLEFEMIEPIQVNLDGEPVQSSSFKFSVFEEKLAICLPSSAPLNRATPA